MVGWPSEVGSIGFVVDISRAVMVLHQIIYVAEIQQNQIDFR
jgi:hypothetical protein